MIDIAKLKKEDVGKWVLYTAPHGTTEKGRIKSWNSYFVFVVYNCAGEWDNFKNYTSAATKPEDLRFTSAEEMI